MHKCLVNTLIFAPTMEIARNYKREFANRRGDIRVLATRDRSMRGYHVDNIIILNYHDMSERQQKDLALNIPSLTFLTAKNICYVTYVSVIRG